MTDLHRTTPPLRTRRLRTHLDALRAPDSGIAFQGARFVIAGATVTLVYLGVTTLLSAVFGLPFQAALIIGFSCGLVVHFSLQRLFVWGHGDAFALSLHHQAARYLVAAVIQYGLTAASTALLPVILGLSTEVVYLATVTVVISTNFLVFRHGIFHSKPAMTDSAPAPIVTTK